MVITEYIERNMESTMDGYFRILVLFNCVMARWMCHTAIITAKMRVDMNDTNETKKYASLSTLNTAMIQREKSVEVKVSEKEKHTQERR